MGRFEKTIAIDSGIDRRELGYYSTPRFISAFMTKKMLEINPNGKYALDPCVGKEEMIKQFYDLNIEIDGIDIHNHGDYFYCNFMQDDFIKHYKNNKRDLLFDQKINLHYDYYIANPPYNCHEVDYIKNNKKDLNNVFGNIGVHNMYSMFISAIIDSAKEGALISIISADSFLTARMHNPLRKQILEQCAINYLILCPTDLFWDQKADVRTCI
jgi:type I restriction-modification system DNA methylase subunit